jgi:hypothetical protein
MGDFRPSLAGRGGSRFRVFGSLLLLAVLSPSCSSNSTNPTVHADAGADREAAAPPALATFQIGAATIDVTPPLLHEAAAPAEFASCDLETYDGPRVFAFQEPYTDMMGTGFYEAGDPYCDANKNHNYDGMFLAGGAGSNRQPSHILDRISAEAVVFETSDGKSQVAMAVVDSIGLPTGEIQAIVAASKKSDPSLSEVLVSSTHDESAPDPLGLWGPSQTTTGINAYYMSFLAQKVSEAVHQALLAVTPAHLRFVEAQQPASLQTVFSSFPFVFDPAVMAMQAVSAKDEKTVIFTLANYAFHAEGYGYSPDPMIAVEMSADWPGVLRKALVAKYGGVGIGMAGLLGSIETPNVYPGATVSKVPVPAFSAGNDNYLIFPDPKGVKPLPPGTVAQTTGIGQAVATSVIDAFDKTPDQWSVGGNVRAVVTSYCVVVENADFLLATYFGIFDRVATCKGMAGQTLSSVAMFDLGDAQIAYLPGEVFPFTVLRGFLGASEMPFPDEPMTPWLASAMTGRYPFFAGLGTDMLGYLMPANDFVGETGEVTSEPWKSWDQTHTNENDRFGWVHNDDGESVGPHAAMAMTTAALAALEELDPGGPVDTTVATGRFVDSEGRASRSPFPATDFSGAVGVWVLPAGSTKFTSGAGSIYLLPGHAMVGDRKATAAVSGFIDAHGQPQSDGYGVATRGVWMPAKMPGAPIQRIFVDTFPGD